MNPLLIIGLIFAALLILFGVGATVWVLTTITSIITDPFWKYIIGASILIFVAYKVGLIDYFTKKKKKSRRRK